MNENGQGSEALDTLPLDSWHRARGGRMVPFAGHWMPVQYEGIIAEHLWTRAHAGLFDVSHMGQLLIHGRGADKALEALLPGDLQALADMKLKYSLLLDDEGGIIDDLMVTRRGEDFYVVVNGATKHADIHEFELRLPREVVVDHMKEQALLALQGPRAAEALETIVPGVGELSFMEGRAFQWADQPLWISRSGYTGEDGFEISVPGTAAEALAEALADALADAEVEAALLGVALGVAPEPVALQAARTSSTGTATNLRRDMDRVSLVPWLSEPYATGSTPDSIPSRPPPRAAAPGCGMGSRRPGCRRPPARPASTRRYRRRPR